MNNKKQISETRSTEVIAYILNQYDKENINRNLDVCAELVLISRIIMQRFKKNFGIDFKRNMYVEKAIEDVLTEMKKDKDHNSVVELIKNYQLYRKNKLN